MEIDPILYFLSDFELLNDYLALEKDLDADLLDECIKRGLVEKQIHGKGSYYPGIKLTIKGRLYLRKVGGKAF